MKNLIFICFLVTILGLIIGFDLNKTKILSHLPTAKISISQISHTQNLNPVEKYVLLNTSSLKYHLPTCEFAKKSHHLKLVPLSYAQKIGKPCKNCFPTPPPIFKERMAPYYADSYLSFYATNPLAHSCPSEKTQTALNKMLLYEINHAKKSIDIAIYEIEGQKNIINALQNAQNRGIKVRLITDLDTKNESVHQNNKKIMSLFSNSLSDKDCQGNALMHNKFFIIDQKIVITGSANISNTDIGGFNANCMIKITSFELAKIYEQEFNQMYEGKFHNHKLYFEKNTINLSNGMQICAYFSPADKTITNAIIPEIQHAQKYIYVPIFFLTNESLANALISARKRGIEIKVILDATAGRHEHSRHEKLRSTGIKVKVENWRGKMHQKSMIIDDKTVIIGSMNFSQSGENKNDENCIIIKNAHALARNYKSYFLELYNSIPDKWLRYNPAPEGFDSPGSCFDGIDNNYDGAIDAKDKRCVGVRR